MSVSDFFSSAQDIDYSDIPSWPKGLKLLVALLIGVLILVAAYMLLYKPKLESFETAKVKEQTLKREYEAKQKLAVNLPLYKQQMVEIKDRFESILAQLPNKSEVPALLTDISEAGIEQGLTFTRFKPSAPQPKNFYNKLPVAIEASGDYHQLSNFISAIANFQRIVSVGNFDMSRNESTDVDVDGPLTLKANIFTYSYSETGDLDSENGEVSRIRK